MKDSILKAKQTISRIESELADDKKYSATLATYRKVLASDIEFETVCSGMGREAAAEGSEESKADVMDEIASMQQHMLV